MRRTDDSFLGAEFLLWLWWWAETRGGLHPLDDGRRVGVAIDRLLEFDDAATGVRVAVRGDAPTRAPEARQALRRRMRLRRAGLIVSLDGENVDLVLDAERFDLRSVKAERPQGETAEERDQAALASLFGVIEALDAVYARFLAARVAPDFAVGVGAEILRWKEGERAAPAGDTPTMTAES